jgi:conjugal transfer pilus assembly protein TrbC
VFYNLLILIIIVFNKLLLPHVGASSCTAIQDLQQESLREVESLQKDPSFQEIVAELQNSAVIPSSSFPRRREPRETLGKNNAKKQGCIPEVPLEKSYPMSSNTWVPAYAGMTTEEEARSSFYIFVSFSLGEKALLNLAQEAKQYGAILVLRGFKDGSYTKTAKALQNIIVKTGQGVVIDPELYSLFQITAVPTFVLTKPFSLQPQERIQTPIHDKLQGHVSVRYALETFAKEGDLGNEAQSLLKNIPLKSGGLL